MGVGVTKRISAVSGGGYKLLVAWIITIPVSMLIAGLVYYFMILLGVG